MQVPKIGDVVAGRYELTGELGRGGFGVVFKATQLGMNRPVALKVLLPQAASVDTVVDRFTREAQLAKNLVHPNTIQLYDFGETEGNCLYISMEFLEGETLDKLLKREGQLPMERAIHIAAQILKSLAEAHEHGIVHRDLKPANIFLRQLVGEKDFVKVLDFGIAKALNLDGNEDEKLTQTGSSFGTPSYMAPEQIRGVNVGAHTDLYSVALIILKMVTGKTAVEGGTPIETAAMQLSLHDIPIPDWVAQTSLGPVLRKALRKEIALRYVNAIDMLQDLQKAGANLRGELVVPPVQSSAGATPVSGRLSGSFGNSLSSSFSGPVPLPPPARPRSNALVIVLVALIVLFVGGALVFLLVLNQPTQQGGTAQAAGSDAGTEKAVEAKPVDDKTTQPAAQPEEKPAPEDDFNFDDLGPPEVIVEVMLQSQPAGAVVKDGEQILGTTPFTAAFDQSLGSRRLSFSGPGYVEEVVELDLDNPQPVNVTLRLEEAVAVAVQDDEPKTDKPETDKPKTDKPKTDKPKTDKPKTDKPKTDKPKTDKPKTEPDDKKPAIPLPDEESKPDKGASIPLPD
ncbi:MAG: protein kinase [Myxococcota bacterium]|jgi:serine/threonine-protein kinase|nr:protein kinase [Myxococcota bacterium]